MCLKFCLAIVTVSYYRSSLIKDTKCIVKHLRSTDGERSYPFLSKTGIHLQMLPLL